MIEHETELVDFTLPPSAERTRAAALATSVHERRHAAMDPATCNCRDTWRRDPSFARTVAESKRVQRAATTRLKNLGLLP